MKTADVPEVAALAAPLILRFGEQYYNVPKPQGEFSALNARAPEKWYVLGRWGGRREVAVIEKGTDSRSSTCPSLSCVVLCELPALCNLAGTIALPAPLLPTPHGAAPYPWHVCPMALIAHPPS